VRSIRKSFPGFRLIYARLRLRATVTPANPSKAITPATIMPGSRGEVSGCSPVCGSWPEVTRIVADALLCEPAASLSVATLITSDGIGAFVLTFARTINVITAPGFTVPMLNVTVFALIPYVPCVVVAD